MRGVLRCSAVLGICVVLVLSGGLARVPVPSADAAACPVQPPTDLVTARTLTIGGALPPELALQMGGTTAFEAELAMAMAQQMCVRVQFVPTAFAGAFPALNAHKFDIIIAQVGITPSGRKPSISSPTSSAGCG